MVTAFDVRSAVKEQIQSLGAKFFEVEGIGDAEGGGGYARELTAEEQEAQRKALTVQMGKSDVIITTALVPGRPAPKLISAEAVAGHAARQRDRRPRRPRRAATASWPGRGRHTRPTTA